MFIRPQSRSDFADTTAFAPGWGTGQALDPIELMHSMDQADRTLLQLVLCAASATLLLALAASLAL